MESVEVVSKIVNECISDVGLRSSRSHDAVFEEQLPSVVSVLSKQSSEVPLVSCDICQEISRRAVSLPCCKSQACRACAVKKITTYKGCWGCGKEAVTQDLKIELGLREAAKVVTSGRKLEVLVREEMELRRKSRDALAKSNDGLRFSTSNKHGNRIEWRCNRNSPIDIFGESKSKHNPDDEEEEDIQDHRWKRLKETRTDRERVLLAKKMFNNAVESDPNRNLSFHGFRSRLGQNKRTYRSKLQESSFEISSGQLDPLPGFKKVKRDDHLRSVSMAEMNYREEKIKIEDIPEVMKEVFLKQLQDRFGAKYTNEEFKELKRFVQHYVKGFKETADFFSFYNLGETEKQVSRERLEEMVDVEKLLGKFTRHYGDIEKTFCKECWVEHRF
eukprot:GFUD01123663.1.p1 GENE.GFUD01123663.1~~GFUD01123663.1.p1  ORF type:complete len:388 (-),score=89.30 GFUD01123663.1:31-1194(-)